MPSIKIVLADDDENQLEVTAHLLANEGYEVVTALSGEDALAKIMESPPDLVISDVEMVGMNGIALAKKLTEDPFLRNIPVILISGGRTSPQDKIEGLGSGSDDYITKPFAPNELFARVKSVLRRNQIGLDANPLTRLPGNTSIIREIEKRLEQNNPFAILYADLNNFKAFNDRYGFIRGDDVIRFAAQILVRAVYEIAPGHFVGHVGGDDFVIITVPDKMELLCKAVIHRFDDGILNFYESEDRQWQGIEMLDRQGQKIFYPIMAIAIGVVTNLKREIKTLGEVSSIGAEMKKYAKSLWGSQFVVDQRTTPSFSPSPRPPST